MRALHVRHALLTPLQLKDALPPKAKTRRFESLPAAEDVGFYYAANAAGRLGGIVLSGVLYQAGGIMLCLLGSALMVGACFLITLLLPVRARRVQATATPGSGVGAATQTRL